MASNVTPENVEAIVSGATPVQIIILSMLGIVMLGVIIAIVKWIVDTKVGTLPQDIKEIKQVLSDNSVKMAQIEAKMWTRDDMCREISSEINHHIATCPYRKNENNIRG